MLFHSLRIICWHADGQHCAWVHSYLSFFQSQPRNSLSHTLWGDETPKVRYTFALLVLETLYSPEQILTGHLHLFGTIILHTKGCESAPYVWQVHPLLYDFPFSNKNVVPAVYTSDSTSRSSRLEFRYFLPIIAKKFNAIWNVSIQITTSENSLRKKKSR